MRANRSSTFASAMALDEIATASSSASTTHSDNPTYMKTLRQFGRYFSTRLVQVVVQSRTNEKFDLECTLPSCSPDWFNLRVDELGEVSAQVKRSISSFPPVAKCISIDFLLYTCDAEVLPMETWTFSIDEEDQRTIWADDIKSQLYLQLGVMLRSAMVAARMTPLHRYYVKKQSCDTFVVLYKLGEGFSDLDLGSEAKKLELGRFPTPVGAFRLQLAYRTQMAKDRPTTPPGGPESNQMSVTASPEVHPVVGSPTPSSYCELLSEFSTSPSSLAAASPTDVANPYLKSGRSRTTSMASDGEPSHGSPKTKSKMSSVKSVPLTNLLAVSYTGALFPLREEVTTRRKKSNSESAIVLGTTRRVTPPRSDSFSRLLGSPPTELEEDIREEKTGRKVEEQLRKQFDTHEKADEAERPTVKVSFELECSERTLVNQESDCRAENFRKSGMDSEEQKESVATIKRSETEPEAEADVDEVFGFSDDDSFVKIPLLGQSPGGEALQEDLDIHLTKFMTSCKAAPQLEGVQSDWDTLSDIKNLLEEFSQKQGVFDKFVAEVREQGEDSR